MWRLLAAVKQRLGRAKKTARVADESTIHHGGGGGGGGDGLTGHPGPGRAPLYGLLLTMLAPLEAASRFTCFSTGGAGEIWVAGELPRSSEMEYLMVRDSMRYAIYV